MTTDTFQSGNTKHSYQWWSHQGVRDCKGIRHDHAQMATMLAFILTNAAINSDLLTACWRKPQRKHLIESALMGNQHQWYGARACKRYGSRPIQRKTLQNIKKLLRAARSYAGACPAYCARWEGATKLISIRVHMQRVSGRHEALPFGWLTRPYSRPHALAVIITGADHGCPGNSGAVFETEKVEITINNLLQ